MSIVMTRLRNWFGEALEYTMGKPSDVKHQPPAIGIQPYRDKPEKVHY